MRSGPAVSLFTFVFAAIGVVWFAPVAQPAPTAPFATYLSAGASMNAFGRSQAVRLHFALPNGHVEFPLEVSGDPTSLAYEWIPIRDTTAVSAQRIVTGASFIAPDRPGFYRLVVVQGAHRQVIAEPTLAVMVPFKQKVGGVLNGYRIGTYITERFAQHENPPGFLEVNAADIDLRITKHLRLRDFLTHDAQDDVWPKYVALNPRLLDKLELVLAKVGTRARFSQPDDSQNVAFDVHSGFRTPAHNARVLSAARDSRHQYGDAVDVAIDANGDGRVTRTDEALVARAVDEVEDEHPDLAGGLGLYTSERYRTPYVHIDTRGTRSRWKG